MRAETRISKLADPNCHSRPTITVVHRHNHLLLQKLLYRGQVCGSPDQRTESIVNVVRGRHLSCRDRGFTAEWVFAKQPMISGHSISVLIGLSGFREASALLDRTIARALPRSPRLNVSVVIADCGTRHRLLPGKPGLSRDDGPRSRAESVPNSARCRVVRRQNIRHSCRRTAARV